jgi:hypothetical protein
MNNKIVTAAYLEGMVHFEKIIFSRRDLKLTSNKSVNENFNLNPFNLNYSHFFVTKALSHEEILIQKTSAKKLSFLNR